MPVAKIMLAACNMFVNGIFKAQQKSQLLDAYFMATCQMTSVYMVFRMIYDHHFLIHQSYDGVCREKIDIRISMIVIYPRYHR